MISFAEFVRQLKEEGAVNATGPAISGTDPLDVTTPAAPILGSRKAPLQRKRTTESWQKDQTTNCTMTSQS